MRQVPNAHSYLDGRHGNIKSSDRFFSKDGSIHILMNGVPSDESFHGGQNAYFICSKQFPLGISLQTGRAFI